MGIPQHLLKTKSLEIPEGEHLESIIISKIVSIRMCWCCGFSTAYELDSKTVSSLIVMTTDTHNKNNTLVLRVLPASNLRMS